jgi:CSLREA domain-containing protein
MRRDLNRSLFGKASRLILLAALCASLVQSAGAAPNAPATTFNVTKIADTNDGSCDGDCSLREAILAANAAAGIDTIVIPAGVYTLSIPGSNENGGATGDLDISDSLTISGQGSATTFIDGNHLDRVFQVVQNSITVTITQVTVQNGAAPLAEDLGGGAILNSGITQPGTLVLMNTVVKNSNATRGGGISNNNLGTLVVDGSTIRDNTSTAEGGGIYSDGGLEITSSVIQANTSYNGAGVLGTAKANMTFEDVLFEGNMASNFGGGIYNDQTIQFEDVTLRSNQALRGGGLYNGFNALLKRVTINNNQAPNGAGLYSEVWASLDNVTISGNQHPSSDRGAGIFNNGILTLTNSTLFQNEAPIGANLYNFENGSATIRNTIFAGALNKNNCFNEGSIVSQGYNLEDGISCPFYQPGDQINKDPKLGPLVNNGGVTYTHKPAGDSPAVDTGDSKNCPVTDQRTRVRPVDGDANGTPVCDIGAVEYDRLDLVAFDPREYPPAAEGTILQIFVRRLTDGGAISVSYRAQSLPRNDFVLTPGTLSWSAGDPYPLKSFTVSILDDSYAEGDEIVLIILYSLIGGVGVEYPNNIATFTIPANDEGSPFWPPDTWLPIIRK